MQTALLIELKCNKTSSGAIDQIKAKKYDAVLKPLKDDLLLVGINYDTKTGEHSCTIERA